MYADSQIIAQRNGGQAAAEYFYVTDRLGSVRQVIDNTGAVVANYTYSPFGQMLEQGGSFANSFLFTGQWFDSEFSQYYLRARQYDPVLMRFGARDPVFGKYENPMTLHVYFYCLNNPINRVDLSGAYWDGPWWAQYEFWAEIGGEIVKGAAATADGFIPIPFFNPFEDVYANPDGTIDSIYRGSRLWGTSSRTILCFALNAYAINSLFASAPGGAVSLTLGERLLAGAFLKAAIIGEAGKGVSLTWGASNAILTTAGAADNILDVLGALDK